MTAVLKNRAGVSTTTTGTGSVTLGAAVVAGTAPYAAAWQTFAAAGAADGNIVRYLILDSNGAWEYGPGTIGGGGTTLTRPGTSMNGSIAGQKSSTGSLLNLSGVAQVFITAIEEDLFRGPASSTDLAVARWDGTNGMLVQDSGLIIEDVSGEAGRIDANKRVNFNSNGSMLASFAGSNPTYQFCTNTNLDWAAELRGYANGNASTAFFISKTRGATPATHNALVNGDQIAEFSILGSDGANWIKAGTINWEVSGTVSTFIIPTYMSISTRGPSDFSERLSLDHAGIYTQLRIEEPSATLTDAANVTLDSSRANVFHLIAAGDRTILAPTNAPGANRTQKIVIRHEASGANRTLTLTTGSAGAFRFGTTITGLTTTTSGTTDYVGCLWNQAASRWDVVSYSKGF